MQILVLFLSHLTRQGKDQADCITTQHTPLGGSSVPKSNQIERHFKKLNWAHLIRHTYWAYCVRYDNIDYGHIAIIWPYDHIGHTTIRSEWCPIQVSL